MRRPNVDCGYQSASVTMTSFLVNSLMTRDTHSAAVVVDPPSLFELSRLKSHYRPICKPECRYCDFDTQIAVIALSDVATIRRWAIRFQPRVESRCDDEQWGHNSAPLRSCLSCRATRRWGER